MRFLARLIDGLLVFIPLAIIFAVIPGLSIGGFVYNIVGALVVFGYYVWMESNQGATLAKQWLKLRVTGESGGNVTMEQSSRRNWWLLIGILGGIPVIGVLASLASLAIVIGIAVTISSDPSNQGFHDRMANARVVSP